MLKKLRLKFVAINMGIVLAMLLVIFGLVYHFTARDLRARAETMVQTLRGSHIQIGQTDRYAQQVSLPFFVVQVDQWGSASISGSSYYDITNGEFIGNLLKRVYQHQGQTGELEDLALLWAVSPVPGGTQYIFLDISSHKDTLGALVKTGALVGSISLVAFLLISILLAWWTVRPVDKAWQQQRQFVSDASHELKTPLTVILNNTELLQNPDTSQEDAQRYAQNIQTVSVQMKDLTQGLLELARADNGQIRNSFSQVDLSQLLQQRVMLFEPGLFERGITVSTQIQEGIHIKGSAQHLAQVADILLDNACKYSAPGVLDLRLEKQGRGCLFTAANPGNPIPQDQLEKIFQRFYRADTARSRDGSYGLGLSIAKAIVEEHHGKIWAQSNETGNCFFVWLPI